MMAAHHEHAVVDLGSVADPQRSGIRSHTLHATDALRVVHFVFAGGEELSEHTSSRPATIQVLSGRFDLTVAGETVAGGPGTLVCMAAGTPHSLRAHEPSRMLLTLGTAPGPSRQV
jgi:quercetin dioxygenase-like cupin family protein